MTPDGRHESRSSEALRETCAVRVMPPDGRDVKPMAEMFSYTSPHLMYGNSPELKYKHYRTIIQKVLLIYTDLLEQENNKRQ